MTIVINLLGLGLIALVIWWFFFAKTKSTRIEGEAIDVLVRDGVYQPARIRIKAGQPIELRFLRQDDSPCSEVVVFTKLNVSEQLPIGKVHPISLQVAEPGEYEFTCQMGMYRGLLIVEQND